MKKYWFQYVFLIILAIGMIYSPVAYAGGVVNAIAKAVNVVVNSVVAAVQFAVTDLSLIGISCDLAGGCGFIDDMRKDTDCRFGNSNDP